MQRFTYTEPRNIDSEAEHYPDECSVVKECTSGKLSIPCSGCNKWACNDHGKYIDSDFFCDACRVCVCCEKLAVMDEGYGLTCSPSSIEECDGDCQNPACCGHVVCNGSLQDIEEADEAAKDQLDWDNGAYNG